MDTYLTIAKTSEGFYSEKRSKFYAFAHHVETVDDAMAIVKDYKRKYHDARHCCYAYVIGTGDDTKERANDDGEPSSTAGKPILGQIHSRNLTNIIVVVIRYYGGVNLGTGGLIVAYRTAAADALDKNKPEERLIEDIVEYNFTYPMINSVMRIVKEMPVRIVNQKFDNDCTITLAIRRSLANELKSRLKNLSFE